MLMKAKATSVMIDVVTLPSLTIRIRASPDQAKTKTPALMMLLKRIVNFRSLRKTMILRLQVSQDRLTR